MPWLGSVFGRLEPVLGEHLGSALVAAREWFDLCLNGFCQPTQYAPFRGLRLMLGERYFLIYFLGLVHVGVGEKHATTV